MSNDLKPLIPKIPSYLLWLLAQTIFVAIAIQSLELTFNVSVFLTLAAILMLGRFYVNILARMFQPATVRILGIAIVLVMPTFYFGRSRNRLIAQPPEEAAALMKKK